MRRDREMENLGLKFLVKLRCPDALNQCRERKEKNPEEKSMRRDWVSKF